MNPLLIISAIRRSFIGAEQVYTNGSCIMFHFILKTIFPDAIAYWSDKARHCISKIGRKFYDINGEVTCTSDYILDEQEWMTVPKAVAFPKKSRSIGLLHQKN